MCGLWLLADDVDRALNVCGTARGRFNGGGRSEKESGISMSVMSVMPAESEVDVRPSHHAGNASRWKIASYRTLDDSHVGMATPV